jgi:hypothetical protein
MLKYILNCLIIYSLSILILAANGQAGVNNSWKLLERDAELTIYSKERTKSGMIPLKTIYSVPYSIEEVVAVIVDTSKKTKWVPRLSRSYIHKKINLSSTIEYAEVDMPWPFTDRDLIFQTVAEVGEDLQTVTFDIKSVEDGTIVEKSNIRAQISGVKLVLRYDSKSKRTIIESEGSTNPGGWIPNWLISFFQKSEVKRTARNFMGQIERKLYSEKDLNLIRANLKKISTKI